MKLGQGKSRLRNGLVAVLFLAVALSVGFAHTVFGTASAKIFNYSLDNPVVISAVPTNIKPIPVNQETPANLTFFNVGHGDSSLIQYKNKTILVDTGKAEDHIAQRLLEKGVNRIDYLIITHNHPDHNGGLPEIQNRLEVTNIIQNTSFEEEFFKVIKPEREYADENDNSLVVSLRINSKKVLIFGDCEFESLRDFRETLLKQKREQIYLLKYPHHGVDDFPLYVHLKPKITVISCGTDGEKHGIPHNVIGEQEENGTKVYWTARDGDININLP